MNYINDLNAVGIGTWSVPDDGSPQRANAIEVGHHIVNFFNAGIFQAVQRAGAADAQDVVSAFSATAQRYQSDTNSGGRCANPDAPCYANNVNIEQATQVVQAAIHWFGPPGMEEVTGQSFQEVRGGGG